MATVRGWFKHILFRRTGLGVAYNATMPSPVRVNLRYCKFGVTWKRTSQGFVVQITYPHVHRDWVIRASINMDLTFYHYDTMIHRVTGCFTEMNAVKLSIKWTPLWKSIAPQMPCPLTGLCTEEKGRGEVRIWWWGVIFNIKQLWSHANT